jgi:hypothetical protein
VIPLLPILCEKLVTEFRAQPSISSFLYVAEILADSFGQTESLILGRLFDALTSIAIESTRKGDNADIENDELLEDLFGMCSRFYRHTPNVVLSSSCLSSLIEVSLFALLSVSRRESFITLFGFINTLLGDETSTLLNSLMIRAAPVLVKNIFTILLAVTPQAGARDMVDALEAVRRLEPHAFTREWLPEGLAVLPPGVLSVEETQQAMIDFSSSNEKAVDLTIGTIAFRCEQRALRSQGGA